MKKETDRSSTLCSCNRPFQHLHADLADFRFMAKFAINPKYFLLLVVLFASNPYTYALNPRKLLKSKLELFYLNVQEKNKTTIKRSKYKEIKGLDKMK